MLIPIIEAGRIPCGHGFSSALESVTIRIATSADAKDVALLHATSWQNTYRGILRDEFLNGPVISDRRELWQGRLSGIAPSNQIVLLEESSGSIQGFACAYLDADPEWGTLLDNLHVAPSLKGRGLGRRLIAEVAQRASRQRLSRRLHLWAYEQNAGARRFYERLGGEITACVAEEAPDGSLLNAMRYCWSDLSGLAKQGENLSG
jgi:ribosomal protein S18 acetylase RimI-like enzyme